MIAGAKPACAMRWATIGGGALSGMGIAIITPELR